MRPPSGGRAEWRVTSVLPQAKPWRRRNSLPPSISITEGRSAAMRRGTQKERHDFCRVFLFGGDEEDRTLDLTDANRTLSQARCDSIRQINNFNYKILHEEWCIWRLKCSEPQNKCGSLQEICNMRYWLAKRRTPLTK